jgi:hypothetical protein
LPNHLIAVTQSSPARHDYDYTEYGLFIVYFVHVPLSQEVEKFPMRIKKIRSLGAVPRIGCSVQYHDEHVCMPELT